MISPRTQATANASNSLASDLSLASDHSLASNAISTAHGSSSGACIRSSAPCAVALSRTVALPPPA
eukprot:6653944-Prymnesium_polylepis.1